MINIDKLRKDCHGWVDQVVGSSQAGIAHQVVDAVADTVEHKLEGVTAGGQEKQEKPLWTPGMTGTPDSVDLYQNDPHILMVASLLAQRDTLDMRATMAEEVSGQLKDELDQAKSARIEETRRADELQAEVDRLKKYLPSDPQYTYRELQAKLTETENILADARTQQAADMAQLSKLGRVARAARTYVREFGHLVGQDREYPEVTDLQDALNDSGYPLV